MPTQTFPAGEAPRVALVECEGTLTIEAWEERGIAVESQRDASVPAQAGDTLVLRGIIDDLRLRVPGDAVVTVERQLGDVTARGIAALTVDRADGDLRIERVANVRLRDIYGHMLIDGAESLAIEGREELRRREPRESHNVEVRNVGTANIEYVSGHLTLAEVGNANAIAVGGHTTARGIGGDLRIRSIGGGCTVHVVSGSLEFADVGGACEIKGVGGELSINKVGGGAEIVEVGAVRRLGAIGGKLTLRDAPLSQHFAAEAPARITVGGSARVELPDQPNLALRVTAGGKIRGTGIDSRAGHLATLIYGEGTGQLSLTVGGSLELSGAATPRSPNAPRTR
jgi:hypothetical protein